VKIIDSIIIFRFSWYAKHGEVMMYRWSNYCRRKREEIFGKRWSSYACFVL